ncbi:MAG TPA: DUF6262 family protein [Nakamurella sp.]
MTRADNSHHLTAAARARSQSTRQRSLAALEAMIRDGAAITFHTVATKAGVSRSWLYQCTDLRDRIIELRDTTRPGPHTPPATRQRASHASLLARLEVTQDRLRRVVADNAALRAQLEQALGIIRAEQQGLQQVHPQRPLTPEADAR